MSTNIWLLLAVICIIMIMYVVLPALKLKTDTGKWFKGIAFASIIIVLAIDFWQKEKYSYFWFLGLGAIGFYLTLINSKTK